MINTATQKDIYNHNAQEYAHNGVYYALLENNQQTFRLGSIYAKWRSELSSITSNPHDFQKIGNHGLWIAPEKNISKVAITCSGIGIVRPHMGRDLYNTFPIIREAMHRVASIVEWDVLSLLDEKDLDKLQSYSYQVAYLFLIEYAQFYYLQSLGFKPHFCAGHSLGELIALTFSGLFSLKTGWNALKIRAQLIEELVQSPEYNMGMMVIYAGIERIQKLFEQFPNLSLSNHNSPNQCVVSGIKDDITQARKLLRKEKCPCIVLPVNMAFHNPYLRKLRTRSLEELSRLPVEQPACPLMSNVTAKLYPKDTNGIYKHIVDLDENTVRWVDCVQNLNHTYGVNHFVELGPGEVISPFTKESLPSSICISVADKRDEVKALRMATAQLFALGHISLKKIIAVPSSYNLDSNSNKESVEHDHEKNFSQAAYKSRENSEIPFLSDIMSTLAKFSEQNVENLQLNMDLRYDLALRSSHYPAILHELEQKIGIKIEFEDVLNATTIQDFALILQKLVNKSKDVTTDNLEQNTEQENNSFQYSAASLNVLTPFLLHANIFQSLAPSYLGLLTESENFVQNMESPILISGIKTNHILDLLAPRLKGFTKEGLTQNILNEEDFLSDYAIQCAEHFSSALSLIPSSATMLLAPILRLESIPNTRNNEDNTKNPWLLFAKLAEHFWIQENSKFMLYQFQKQFSAYKDHFSIECGDNKEQPSRLISNKSILQTIFTAINVPMSSFTLYGLDNFQSKKTPYWQEDCVEGVTREACGIVQVTPLEGDELQAKCQLYMRDISPNGRRLSKATNLACATLILSSKNKSHILKPIFEDRGTLQVRKNTLHICKDFAKHGDQWQSQAHCISECIQEIESILHKELACDKELVLESIAHIRYAYNILHAKTDSLQIYWKYKSTHQPYNIDVDVHICSTEQSLLITFEGMRFTLKNNNLKY